MCMVQQSARFCRPTLSRTAHSRPSTKAQRTAVRSPFCEFGFLAVCACRTENAASAKSSELPCGGKTGHSCKPQREPSCELTGCGLSGRMLAQQGFSRTYGSPSPLHHRLCGGADKWLSVDSSYNCQRKRAPTTKRVGIVCCRKSGQQS